MVITLLNLIILYEIVKAEFIFSTMNHRFVFKNREIFFIPIYTVLVADSSSKRTVLFNI